MHEIILIRHGEAAKSPTEDDPGLTPLGQEQAAKLAEKLQKHYPNGAGIRLISSPKSRALQTAIPVATLWKKRVEQQESVIEIPSPQGVTLAQRGDWIRSFLRSGWDTLTPAQNLWRDGVLEALKQLDREDQCHTTLVFCHFMVINTVVAAIRQDLRVSQFLPDYTSQTRLQLQNDHLSIVALGRERHAQNRIQ